jgi:hypothetical protein
VANPTSEKAPSSSVPLLSPRDAAELAAVLGSATFSRASRQAAILSYLCSEYGEGRAAEIKEYTIAVYALGRDPKFDPANESIVRVEVSRLRKRLRQFYETEGAAHEIEIRLPEVGYAVQFVPRGRPAPEWAPGGEAVAPARPRASWLSPRRSLAAVLVAATLILAVVLVAVAVSRARKSAAPVAVPPEAAAPAAIVPVRISAGSSDPRYVDRSGLVWTGDRFFSGGHTVARPDHRILRTHDPNLYQKAREGEFIYDIPLESGVYELHLHFAEIVFRDTVGSGVEGQRRFNVTANGKPLLTRFDIALDAPGADVADERIFTDISPAPDGFLHLRFEPAGGREALVSGVEILPGAPRAMGPVRILAASRSAYDHAGRFWSADRYFSGGRIVARLATIPSGDQALLASERFGAFSYFIPVAPGRYSATFHFAESNFGVDNIGLPTGAKGGVGDRLFNLYCNGIALARGFDIYREAGGPLKPVSITFRNLTPNAQGKLVFWFEPVRDYPTLSAIEILSEAR